MREGSSAADRSDRVESAEVARDRGSLLGIAFAPMIWAGHFLFVYVLAAIICAKSPQQLAATAGIIAVSTAIAAIGILLVAWPSMLVVRRERRAEPAEDSPAGRRWFLARASLLLSGLSLVAVFLQTMPAVLAASCR